MIVRYFRKIMKPNKKKKMPKYTAFTDGSAVVKGNCRCEKKDCPRCNMHGGWGVYLLEPDSNERMFSRGYSHTKTGRMELMALIAAISKVPNEQVELHVYSDSKYTVDTFNKWMYDWERYGFAGKANVDLVQKLLSITRSKPKVSIFVRHIKGHQKAYENDLVKGNTIADILADYKRHKTRTKDL